MSHMERIVERVVARIMKEAGFEACSSRSLRFITAILEDRLEAILRSVSSQSQHAGRPSTTFTDLLGMVIQQNAFMACDITGYTPPISKDESSKRRSMLFSLPSISPEEFPRETIDPGQEWVSPISTKVEKFIHIYDFMPSFPPMHTFRQTSPKASETAGLSSRVKHRLEQSLVTESNMIKLIKLGGSLPKFVNYIHNRKD